MHKQLISKCCEGCASDASDASDASESKGDNYLGSYLAGLIEGDGSIIVPKTIRNQKGKMLYPSISSLRYFIEIKKRSIN